MAQNLLARLADVICLDLRRIGPPLARSGYLLTLARLPLGIGCHVAVYFATL